jgi:putative selenate reductase FAD-binding subunit
MVQDYLKAASLGEALALKADHPGFPFLAGGTFLLAGDYRDKPSGVIDVGGVLPRGIDRSGDRLVIGAGATFQDLADSRAVPVPLKAAALSMVNRNVRNRATVGGNLAAAKSCASLIPLALALGSRLRVAAAEGERDVATSEWLSAPAGLVLELAFEFKPGQRAAFARYARTSCDVSVLTVGLSFFLGRDKRLSDLRIAMGGLGPRARECPELDSLFQGEPLPPRAEIEAKASATFSPRADLRGSAEFKRLRAAALLADALHNAEEIA